MNINDNIEMKLRSLPIPEEQIIRNEPMSRHTSFRIGGDADWYVTCNNETQLSAILAYLTQEDIPHFLIGNGSNLLFPDSGYRGVIVHLAGAFNDCTVETDRILSGSAKLLSAVSALAARSSLSGMEFASGIPGSIGGAVYMNAGAYGGEMQDIVTRVWVMAPDGSSVSVKESSELAFRYRNSLIQETGGIVTRVELQLARGDEEAISAKIQELTAKRTAKQPVNYPSAGSTFKRPVGGYAAALIEEAGLKGCSVGGAQVSEKHSGFIINTGGATAEDVLNLMRLVRRRVYEHSGILLEPEVRIIGPADI